MPKAASNSYIDVGQQQVGRMYARAFLGAAEEAGAADALVEQFDSLMTDVLDRYPDLETILASRLIDPQDKVGMIDRMFAAQAAPLLLSFLKVLARHERLDCLRAIHRATGELFAELRSRTAVRVSTATPLDGATRSQLAQTLRAMLGGDPQLEPDVQPELIGGVVLRVGDTVYDGSVATQLKRARVQMLDRSIHEIQSGRDRFRHPEGN